MGDVDRVVAGPGANDQLQGPRSQRRLGYLRAAHDEHVGGDCGDLVDQCLVLHLRAVRHLASERSQSVQSGVFKAVSNEHAHDFNLSRDGTDSPVDVHRLGRLTDGH